MFADLLLLFRCPNRIKNPKPAAYADHLTSPQPAKRRINRQGSNRHWMKVQWLVNGRLS
jgi:hypothetical protein